MPFDRDKYPNLHRWLGELPDWYMAEAHRELEQLIAEREQAARRDAAREAKAIAEALLSKVDGLMVDVDALCRELGVDR